MKSQSGQALIFSVVLLPILVFLGGVVVRSGKTALIHFRVQRHCDQKALDASAELAKGLEALGLLNHKCRATIVARRAVDVSIAVALPTQPEAVPELLKTRKLLVDTQKKLALIQKSIEKMAVINTLSVLKKATPSKYKQKITESFTPAQNIRLFVKEEVGYQGETAAPLVLDDRFEEKQNIIGKVKIQTERFLKKWNQFKTSPNMTVQCKAQVKMEKIESPWTVALQSLDKGSSKPLWP